MPFEHFLIPFSGGPAQEELNRFLSTHRILQIDRRQVESGWAYCLEYGDSKAPVEKPPFRRSDKKPDDGYEERLGPDGFRLYLKLKDWRKERGERDKVPRLFKIFSNAQLAEIARYLKLWHWRKAAAERDGVKQNFTIFTNAQLAEMAQKPPRSLADVRKIDGVGEGRVQKYGNEVLSQLRDETSDGPVPEDPGLEQSDPSLPSGEEGEEEPG
jgi:superfamily II DNA helicase RecQ